jgi:hypothetical protein
MKPLGWFSERGGTTFAGEGGRHIEKVSEAELIDSGVLEFIQGIEDQDPEDYQDNSWGGCELCHGDRISNIGGKVEWCISCCPGLDNDLSEC